MANLVQTGGKGTQNPAAWRIGKPDFRRERRHPAAARSKGRRLSYKGVAWESVNLARSRPLVDSQTEWNFREAVLRRTTEKPQRCQLPTCNERRKGGGRGGIRTPGWVSPSPDFELGQPLDFALIIADFLGKSTGADPCGLVHWRSGGLIVDSWTFISNKPD